MSFLGFVMPLLSPASLTETSPLGTDTDDCDDTENARFASTRAVDKDDAVDQGTDEPPSEQHETKSSSSTAGSQNEPKFGTSGMKYVAKEDVDLDALPRHSWGRIPANSFRVRRGPDYPNNKQKAPSADALLEVVCVDQWVTSLKTRKMYEAVTPPSIEELNRMADQMGGSASDAKKEDIALPADVPPIFILHLCYPNYNAPMPWSAHDYDGPSLSWVIYCRFSTEGRRALRDGTPAGQLLRRFLNNLDDETYHTRFKWISQIDDSVSPYKVPTVFKAYNGKPVLTRPQHKFYKCKEYVEAFVDCHEFNYAWRQGVYSFISTGRVERVVLDVGFVVEAREEDEMPEQLLFGVRLFQWTPKQAAKLIK